MIQVILYSLVVVIIPASFFGPVSRRARLKLLGFSLWGVAFVAFGGGVAMRANAVAIFFSVGFTFTSLIREARGN